MTQPARPDRLAAASRVKDAAVDLATDVAQGIRKSNRYAKLRGAVVGTWVVLALVTFWAACPPSGPTNALGALVQLDLGSFMGAQVLVQNDSGDHWTDVVLTLDDAWQHEKKTIRAGDKVVLSIGSFQKGGVPAPRDLKPRRLTIACRQGQATVAIGSSR